MSDSAPENRLLKSITQTRNIFSLYPQGSNLAFEKLMNKDFVKQTNALKLRLTQLIQSFDPELVFQQNITQDKYLQNVAKYVDSLIQQSVCYSIT